MEFQLRFYVFNPHIFYTSNDDSQSVLMQRKFVQISLSSLRAVRLLVICFRLPIIHIIEYIIAYCDISEGAFEF
jgi:hypothetical protein